MTRRERFLAAMRRQPPFDELVWAPNFDYWLAVNRAQGTLPEKYRDMGRNDIVRAIDATIWNRVGALERHYDPAIVHSYGQRPGGVRFHQIDTPMGTIVEEFSPTESEHSTQAHSKHFVSDLDSLRVMTYVVEGTRLSANFDAARQAVSATGEDGIVLHMECCVPLIQFAKTDAGYLSAFYLMEDYPKEVDRLISAYHRQYVSAYKLLAESPADVLEFNDNMDELMISPNLFEKYAVGFYQDCKEALLGSGKIMEAHWCGRTQHLLPMLPKTGIDVVEAVVTEPMAAVTLEAALDALDGRVTLQGGIPSVLVVPDITPLQDFERYIETVVLSQRGRPGFILGMSDNVPPNADFSRVEMISKLIGKES